MKYLYKKTFFSADDIRQELWHRLLDIDLSKHCENSDVNDLLSHSEYSQVVLDVNRSLKRFPPGIPIEQRLALQDQLTLLILKVIRAYPNLRYYQVCGLVCRFSIRYLYKVKRTAEMSFSFWIRKKHLKIEMFAQEGVRFLYKDVTKVLCLLFPGLSWCGHYVSSCSGRNESI